MSQALCFNSVQFDVIPQNSQPWVRGYQIGTALGYGDNADISIRKLYARHADEFTDAMTTVVTLPTEGGPQETRIFSLRGCHLLAMFARTPIAKEFRKWVLDVIEHYGDGVHVPSQEQSLESVLQRIYTLPAGEYDKATKDERHPIDHARKAWVAAAAANGRVIQHSDSWKIIRGHFGNITRIDDLPAAWVMDAVRFCQEMLAHETMVKIREERELEERAERRATAALPAASSEQPAQSPLPVSVAQLDIAGIETAMEEATRRQLAYSEAVFNLMNKVRAPFWEREGRQASPALKGLMQAMARGLGDMQMTAAHAHNAVIASAAIAVEGCKLLADEGRV